MHGLLDSKGLLDASHNAGTYALEVTTPDSVEGVARAFLEVGDATPADATMGRLTDDRVAYVGASNEVYNRLMDHCRSEVRQATFLQAFDVVDVVGVWPSDDDPFEAEYNRAAALWRDGWTCWYDGEIV